MRTHVLKEEINLVTEDCITCGVTFAMPERFKASLQETGKSFYCPAGHSMVYSNNKDQQIKDLKDKIEQAEGNVEFWRNLSGEAENELKQERRQHASTKGQLTKTKKRHAAGVCPC